MSRRPVRWIALFSLWLTLLSGFPIRAAHAGEPAPTPAPAPGAARGAAVLAPFKAELKKALHAGLAEGSIEAIGACRLRAPEIARELSRDGIRVGRTSHRLRNPANAPPEWVKPMLEAFVSNPASAGPRVHALPEGRVGYVEPIVMQPLCVTCHGEVIAPALETRIEGLYPEDRAVGFRVGELRGLFWVELPATDSAAAAD